MSLSQAQIDRVQSSPTYTYFCQQVSDQSYRIADDPRIYTHLFIHGQFWVHVRTFLSLCALQDDIDNVGPTLAMFFLSVERTMILDAAIRHVYAMVDYDCDRL